MAVYSTARVGAGVSRIMAKDGRVLYERSTYEPSWREIQAGSKSADIRKAYDRLSPALRSLAEVADLVADTKFGGQL